MQPAWPPRSSAPNDGKAVASLVLGIVSLLGSTCWLGLPLGIPAIVFGVVARRDIRRSDGATSGSGMAMAGIVMGSISCVLFVGGVAMVVFMLVGSGALGPARPTPVPHPHMAHPVPTVAPPSPPPGAENAVHVVELHASKTETLLVQLRAQAQQARAARETVLVETTSPTCGACTEIAGAMPDPALQRALSGVRVVRVDVTELGAQAAALRLVTPGLPWFYLLDGQGAPRDGISADEWDDNDAENVAPVLAAFLAGELPSRRVPWRGSTAL